MLGTVEEFGDIVNSKHEEWSISDWPKPDPDGDDE